MAMTVSDWLGRRHGHTRSGVGCTLRLTAPLNERVA